MHEKKYIEINNDKIAYFEHKTDKVLKRIVLFCHGFPGNNRLAETAKALNDHGITLIEANYRGDEGCEGKFSFFGSMEDIRALTEHTKEQYSGVPITILGFSAGGFYTSCLIRKQPDLFDKVVLLNPLLDVAFTRSPMMDVLWEEARESLQLYDSDFYKHEIEKMHKEYNPIEFVAELTPEIHIVQSSDDEVLPPATAESFYDKLQNPGELVWISNAKHSISGNEPELINVLI